MEFSRAPFRCRARIPGIATFGIVLSACGLVSSLTSRPEPFPGLVTAHITNSTEIQRTLARAATGDTAEREAIRATVEERLTSLANDVPGVLRISDGRSAGGEFVDTMVLRRADLAPVWEHLRYPGQGLEKRIDFKGKSVAQQNRRNDSLAAFDKHYSRDVFAFSEVDLVVRSLPYTRGYQTILPLYSEGDDSLELDTIAVIGTPSRSVTLRFADAAIVATYTVDSLSRRLIAYEFVSRRSRTRFRRLSSTP